MEIHGRRPDPAATAGKTGRELAASRRRSDDGTPRAPVVGARARQRIRGFTLVEALAAVSILAMAASALLLASQASAESTRQALEQTIAAGIAAQLVDEVLGLPYKEEFASPFAWPLQPEAGEVADPPRRILFDDADDFHGYHASPIEDAWSIPLGTGDDSGGLRRGSFALPANYFHDWSATIAVRYVDEENPSLDLPAGSTSGLRAVSVSVSRAEGGVSRNLATMRRLFAYVPPPP